MRSLQLAKEDNPERVRDAEVTRLIQGEKCHRIPLVLLRTSAIIRSQLTQRGLTWRLRDDPTLNAAREDARSMQNEEEEEEEEGKGGREGEEHGTPDTPAGLGCRPPCQGRISAFTGRSR